MGFVRLDEMTDDHPKVIAAIDTAGEAAAWLWLRSICYSARTFTDGFIPTGKVVELARAKDVKRKTAALVAAGLWEQADGGYIVHDFLEHNTSAAERKAARQKNADRVAKHRSSRNGDVTPLPARDSGADVTASQRSANAPIEVEVEVEQPPQPPQGGRGRDQEAFQQTMAAWARRHFPDANVGLVQALASNLRSTGVEPTVEAMREYATTHPQWSAGITEAVA